MKYQFKNLLSHTLLLMACVSSNHIWAKDEALIPVTPDKKGEISNELKENSQGIRKSSGTESTVSEKDSKKEGIKNEDSKEDSKSIKIEDAKASELMSKSKGEDGAKKMPLPPCKGSYSKIFWTECVGLKTSYNGPHFFGSSYNGEFKEGRPHGHGEMINHDGTRFVGDFEMGVRDGAGAEFAKDGTLIVEGFWRAGVLVKTFKSGGTNSSVPELASSGESESKGKKSENK